MSCSISSTVTSRGSAATAARISWRSPSGTPAAGSSSSSTRGLVGDGDRDLQQALLAVGQRRGRLVHHVEQMEARQVLRDLGVDVVARAHPPPPVAAAAEPFRHREPDGLERRQIGIELVDLEGARQPAQHALYAPANR